MFRQGDQERALRLPVSPLMDRSKSGITKSQGKGQPCFAHAPGQAAHCTAADAPQPVSYHISHRVSTAACTAPIQAVPAALQIAAHLQLVSSNHMSTKNWPASTG